MKLLFIIGMQKSGTSLLNRILMHQDNVENPFLPEGKLFWGDDPPFQPEKPPCGLVYQSYNGEHGHFMDEFDYSLEHKELLESRIKDANIQAPILMNKNPYNSVRIRWLKAVFPSCKIVAVYRNPIANVYSLLKKYSEPEQKMKHGNSWWGIKPKHWKSLLSENKIVQSSSQWVAVNKEILDNLQYIDCLWSYDKICNEPNKLVQTVYDFFDIQCSINKIGFLKNFDYEYKVGSRLTSKNQEFRKNTGFDLSNLKEKREFLPLNNLEIQSIKEACSHTWSQLINAKHQ